MFKALSGNQIDLDHIVELGTAIESTDRIRISDEQITVADLTGVAVQDIQIAKAVCQALNQSS